MPTGTIIVPEPGQTKADHKVVVYARVSSSENRSNLDSQAERITAYCLARGYQIERVVKEVRSEGDKNELMQDLIAVITSFVARYYGQRRVQRKTEKIIRELQNDNGDIG